MRRTLKERQELCLDLLAQIYLNDDSTLLEMIIDEYIYRLNDQELDELEETMYEVNS